MVICLGRFIPNLSKLAAPLPQLKSEDTAWEAANWAADWEGALNDYIYGNPVTIETGLVTILNNSASSWLQGWCSRLQKQTCMWPDTPPRAPQRSKWCLSQKCTMWHKTRIPHWTLKSHICKHLKLWSWILRPERQADIEVFGLCFGDPSAEVIPSRVKVPPGWQSRSLLCSWATVVTAETSAHLHVRSTGT